MKEFTEQEQEWVEAYLNGTIDPNSFEALQDRMMECPALRKVMRSYLSLDFHLQDGGSDLDSVVPFESPPKVRKPWFRSYWAAAAALAVFAAGLLFGLRDANTDIATITAINGPVQWTSGDGQVRDDLIVGGALSGGLLEPLLPDSWIEFAFDDGSKVTLSGQSRLTLSDKKRKELHLSEGSLSAEVVSQPKDAPMLVHTQTAKLAVLGTQFNVNADPMATRLVVNEGRVRMERLIDGSAADVPAGKQAIATVSDNHELSVMPRGKAKRTWHADLSKEDHHGKWESDLEALGAKLKAAVAQGKLSEDEAFKKFKALARHSKKGDGRLRTTPKLIRSEKGAMHIVHLSMARGDGYPIIATARAMFHVRGNLQADATVTFGFNTQYPNGGFAGKHDFKKGLKATEDGFQIELPLEAFHREPDRFPSPFDLEITDWWCVTNGQDAGLEITHVELLTD